MDSRTSGALVDQRRMTQIPGIFACGNVLHVHDLVDFVSEEAEIAGRGAAEYIRSGGATEGCRIQVQPGKGIRYTLPQFIHAAENTTVFFRVTDVHSAVKIVVRSGDEVILSQKRPRVAPGEMETVKLTAKTLMEHKEQILTIELEENSNGTA